MCIHMLVVVASRELNFVTLCVCVCVCVRVIIILYMLFSMSKLCTFT